MLLAHSNSLTFWSHTNIYLASLPSVYICPHQPATSSNYKSHLNCKSTFCDTRYPCILAPIFMIDLESRPRRPQLCPKSYIPAEASGTTQETGGGAGPRICKGTQWVSQPKGRKKIIPCPSASLPGPSFCRTCIRTI